MIFLPEHLPAAAALSAAGLDVATYSSCPTKAKEGERVRHVLLLNLMPQKLVTELDIARTLAETGRTVCLTLVRLPGQTFKTTPMEHILQFYRELTSELLAEADGLIVTGAPLENIAFEEVRYWQLLEQAMDEAARRRLPALYICWAAQAALYHFYKIPKHPLPHKMFGIFEQKVLHTESAAMQGLAPAFPMPNSRHTEVRRADFPAAGELQILCESEESGIGAAYSEKHSATFIVGHLEYEPFTLHNEYRRDLAKGLPIQPPLHYYIGAPEAARPDYTWHAAAVRFYANWLDTCLPL